MKRLNTIASAVALMVATTTCSFAATEIDEKDFGPTYGSMVADTIVGKPLGALAVVGGVVTAIARAVALPSKMSKSISVPARSVPLASR